MKGRKRHNVVAVLGLVLGCYVTSAKTVDVKAAPAVLVWVLDQFERLVKVLADQGCRGTLGALLAHFLDEQQRSVAVELSARAPATKGFPVEPKRWMVERTWTWFENARSLTRAYERLPENHEGMIDVVMMRLMLRRLTQNRRTWASQPA